MACNSNAWSTENIIKDWYFKVWDSYLINGNCMNDDNEGFLILDSTTSHLTDNLKATMITFNRDGSFIPQGLTHFYQPLDVCINKPLKQAIKEKYIQVNDEKDLKFNMDFIGVQNYTREVIRYAMFVPYLRAKIVSAKKRKVEMTEMNWEVYPASIYYMLKKFSSYS